MEKIAEQIADRVMQKCALYPFQSEQKKFEGTPEEWAATNTERAEKLKTLLPAVGGGVGAATGAGMSALLSSGAGLSGKQKLIRTLLGALGGGAGGVGMGALQGGMMGRELKKTSPEDWKQGLETFNKRFQE